MKPAGWLKAISMAVCIVWQDGSVFAEEPEPVTLVDVEVGKVVKATLHRYVMAYGAVEAEPANGGKPPASSRVAAPVTGILTQIHCEEGQRVDKGYPLFLLDTRAADALVAKAEVAEEFAEKNFARKQQMVAGENVSRKLYDEAEQILQLARKDLANAQTQRELLQITAPIAGTVAAIYSKVGEAVGLNTVLADLIDLDRLVVALRVPSQEAAWLRRGQSAEINANARVVGKIANTPGTQRGIVSFIGPQVDPRTDTVLVLLSPSKGSTLRPGQFVSARMVVEELAGRLAVPVASVVRREASSVIAVVEGDKARQRPVKTGMRDGTLIEVEGEGLHEGLGIVTQGAYGLPPETRIRVVKSGDLQ